MSRLNHQIIYRKNENLINEEWKEIKYNPLSIDGIVVPEEDYFEIHDEIISWFFDIFNWVKMYNPSKNEETNGFCYGGITVIKDGSINKLNKIIKSLIDLFNNSPSEMILRGYLCCSNDECCYRKINIGKDKIINILTKFNNITEKAIENGGYILHCGI